MRDGVLRGRSGQQQEVGLLPDTVRLAAQGFQSISCIEGFDCAIAAGTGDNAPYGWLQIAGMFLHEIFQRSQTFRDPGAAIKQTGCLAERLVIEANRLAAKRCERLDRSGEFLSCGLVAKKLQALFGGYAKTENTCCTSNTPGRSTLARR